MSVYTLSDFFEIFHNFLVPGTGLRFDLPAYDGLGVVAETRGIVEDGLTWTYP